MKVKNLFITLGLAMAAALGAGLGLSAKAKIKEAKAIADGWYLVGDFNGWSTTEGYLELVENPNNVNERMYQGLVFTEGNTYFKMIHVRNSGENIDWWKTTSNPGYPIDTYINSWYVNEGDDYGNVGVHLEEGRVAVLDIYMNTNNGNCALNYSTMTLNIGGNTTAMTKDTSSSDPQFKGTISGCAIGNTVSISSHGTDIPLAKNGSAGNNLTDDLKVRAVGGNLTVYYNAYSGSTWVDGYDANIDNWVNGFLADTIDNLGVCADPSTIDKNYEEESVPKSKKVWAYYKDWHNDMTADQKTLFQSAVTAVGTSGEYHGELQEAAKRYIVLLGKYSSTCEEFSGVEIPTSSSRIVSPINTQAASNTAIVVITISAVISLIALGGFFFIRKTKEER